MNADRTLTAIRADAATSDAEGRRDLAGHLADFRAALLDEAALIAAADRSRFDSEVATLTATRDIVIGQRETAQRERDEARGLLHALTADLNATREKLATAEAFRDSLQAEVDGLRVERDAQQADLVGLHCAAAERDTVRELLKAARGALVDVANATGVNAIDVSSRMVGAQCAAAIDALRAEVAELRVAVLSEQQKVRSWQRSAEQSNEQLAVVESEVDKLRARPVLTEEAAIAAAREAGWSSSAGRDAETVISCILAHLGAVTLPAQDAAAALWKAIDDQIVVEAEKVRDGSGVDWHSAYSGAIGTRAKAEAIVRAALASLGAPATTPSKPSHVCGQCQKPTPGVAENCRAHEWIGVDLDGTLAHHDTWRGLDHIGDPVPAMTERVRSWLAAGMGVRILTARVSDAAQADAARAVIERWCAAHLGRVLPVTCIKDMHMTELWDDRAITVEKNTGRDLRPGAGKPGATVTTPSKPADVFAGVSIGKLCDAYDCAGACGSADVAPRRYAGVMAVLDALRAKLVAPVDPIVVATDYHDHPSSAAPRWMCDDMDGFRVDAARAMRATLTAAGIPVTPEAGK